MWILTFIIILVVLGFFYIASCGSESVKKEQQEFDEKYKGKIGILMKTGTFLGGHPEVSTTLNNCFVSLYEESQLYFFQSTLGTTPKYRFSIPKDSVKNIIVEDASTFDKKVTLGRVMLVGVFALAWKKNQKNENAVMSIEWVDGKFTHSTLFTIEGQNAMTQANVARNYLIKICR